MLSVHRYGDMYTLDARTNADWMQGRIDGGYLEHTRSHCLCSGSDAKGALLELDMVSH